MLVTIIISLVFSALMCVAVVQKMQSLLEELMVKNKALEEKVHKMEQEFREYVARHN